LTGIYERRIITARTRKRIIARACVPAVKVVEQMHGLGGIELLAYEDTNGERVVGHAAATPAACITDEVVSFEVLHHAYGIDGVGVCPRDYQREHQGEHEREREECECFFHQKTFRSDFESPEGQICRAS